MKALKELGMEEIQGLKKRALRLLAMKRIAPADASYIVTRCNEIEARIVQMREHTPEEEF